MHIYACARVIICARFTCTVNLLNITNRLSHRWICHWNVHYRKHGRIENECLCWRSTHWIRNERLNRICFMYRRACERVRRTYMTVRWWTMDTRVKSLYSVFFCSTFGGCECNGASHSNNSLSRCASIPSRFFVFFLFTLSFFLQPYCSCCRLLFVLLFEHAIHLSYHQFGVPSLNTIQNVYRRWSMHFM